MPDLLLRYDEGDQDPPPDATFATVGAVPADLQRMARDVVQSLARDVRRHDERAAEKMAALLALEEAYWVTTDPAQFGASTSPP